MYDFILVGYCKYSPRCTIFELFDVEILVIGTEGHSNWYHSKLGCGFLFASRSNYGRIFNCL